jgi:hypothetical protein
MRCLSCGHLADLHVRADGHCLGCACPAMVEKWADETPAESPKAKAKPQKADPEKD